VTTRVRATGEVETQFCAPDNYVVVTGPELYVAHVNSFANGTRVVTIKRAEAPADLDDGPDPALAQLHREADEDQPAWRPS
jgi:hypothetical protein